MTLPVVRIEQLLWKTRGLHWDYEFIAIPRDPQVAGWTNILEELLGHEDPAASRLWYGELEVLPKIGGHQKSFAFVATRFFDPQRCDWTGRRVQHFALWLRDTDDLLTLPDATPTDWHLAVLDGLGLFYGGNDAFDMDEQRIRDWRKTHAGQTRAEFVSNIVRRAAPITLSGPSDATQWSRSRLLQVKKKSADDTTPLLRAVSDQARRPGATASVVLIALAALIVGIFVFQVHCGS